MIADLPPLHPALVHFPIALVTLSFVFDILGKLLRKRSFYSAGWWTLCAGAITGIMTVALGYFDMNRAMLNRETHEIVDIHMRLGWLLLAAVAVITLWRWTIRRSPEDGPTAFYLVAALFAVTLTLFQGWYGGEMVYSHGAGVAAAQQGTQTEEHAQQTLQKVNSALSRVPGLASAPRHRHHEIEEPAGSRRDGGQK